MCPAKLSKLRCQKTCQHYNSTPPPPPPSALSVHFQNSVVAVCAHEYPSSRRTAVDAGGAEARVVAHGLGHAQQLVGQLARGAEHQCARPPRPRRRPSGLPILQQLHLRLPVKVYSCAVIPK